MSLPKLICCCSILIVVFSELKAQEKLSGILLNEESKESVEGCHVLNLTKKAMAISDEDGKFLVAAQAFDTILVTNVQFERRQFIVKQTDKPLVLLLKPLIVQLKEVEVSNLPKNSSVFSEKLKKMKDQDSENFRIFGVKPSKAPAEIPPLFQEDNSLRFWEDGYILPPLVYDIYIIPKLLNRKYKSEMKYYALKAEQKEVIAREKKFNRDFIALHVPLEGELLTDFINFIEVDNDFIRQANEYEMAIYIKRQYDKFMNFD